MRLAIFKSLKKSSIEYDFEGVIVMSFIFR